MNYKVSPKTRKSFVSWVGFEPGTLCMAAQCLKTKMLDENLVIFGINDFGDLIAI